MKFERNDEIYHGLVETAGHELYVATENYKMFRQAVKIASDLDNKLINAFCYQYYAQFVRSLYEFYVAIIKWNEGNTRKLNHEDLDIAMNDAVQRLLNFHAPLKSSDPTFPKSVPEKFGYHFRQVRNTVSHADYRRMLPRFDTEGITVVMN